MGSSQYLDIAAIKSGVLRKGESSSFTVGQLEAALLTTFPRSDALEWDRMGLLVGDPACTVSKIAIALDATSSAVVQAHEQGANVLLTHHPVFLDPPDEITPQLHGTIGSQNAVWRAASLGISLINIHTALDASIHAAALLPRMLGLSFKEVLDKYEHDTNKGFGQVCEVDKNEGTLTLTQLAARTTTVFGRIPRVWGNPRAEISCVVTCTGSSSDLVEKCFDYGVDCLVCGEIRYHSALEAHESGLCIIELGHDTSELPLCGILVQACLAAGVPEELLFVLDQGNYWWTPEAIRR